MPSGRSPLAILLDAADRDLASAAGSVAAAAALAGASGGGRGACG